MDIFLKVMAVVLVTSILSLVLSKQSTDISMLLTIVVCCIVFGASAVYIEPILGFAYRLVELGDLNTSFLNIILKSVGIGMISQIATLICIDSGNQSLGKVLQIMTTAVILSLSVPILEQMLSLIETVLEEV